MISLLAGPGFLGSHAPFYADFTLVLIVAAEVLFTAGWWLIRHKKESAHHWVQTGAAILNAFAVISVMIPSFLRNLLPGLPAKLLQGTYGVTTLHAIIGASGLLLGVFIVLRTNGLMIPSLRFTNYKAFMRTSYILYLLATLIGITVYIAVYA